VLWIKILKLCVAVVVGKSIPQGFLKICLISMRLKNVLIVEDVRLSALNVEIKLKCLGYEAIHEANQK
jgi:hypothetical protein